MEAGSTLLTEQQRASFAANGFLIVDVIPPAELPAMRGAFERLVEKQRGLWAAEAAASGEPSAWETGAQPRVMNYDRLVEDRETAKTVELLFSPSTMGICSELMGGAEVGCACYMLMCSPQQDHGPAHWHRNMHPPDQGPLGGIREDLKANGPGLIQWNLSLLDDEVLCKTVTSFSICRAFQPR